jgi:DNA-binding HxlR family transcriptional regulator
VTSHIDPSEPRVTSRHGDTIDELACRSFQGALELVGRRWTGAILLAGSRGARRFSEYRAIVDGVSDRLLAQRLRELEAEQLIERTVIPTTPVQIRYALTERGAELMSVLQPLAEWSLRHEREKTVRRGRPSGRP